MSCNPTRLLYNCEIEKAQKTVIMPILNESIVLHHLLGELLHAHLLCQLLNAVCDGCPREHLRVICGHIHDELIIEASQGVNLQAICEQMGRVPPWLPGAVLRADGYETEWYRKD